MYTGCAGLLSQASNQRLNVLVLHHEVRHLFDEDHDVRHRLAFPPGLHDAVNAHSIEDAITGVHLHGKFRQHLARRGNLSGNLSSVQVRQLCIGLEFDLLGVDKRELQRLRRMPQKQREYQRMQANALAWP